MFSIFADYRAPASPPRDSTRAQSATAALKISAQKQFPKLFFQLQFYG
jgi:hypothetical protein